jgi:hypothetical protein
LEFEFGHVLILYVSLVELCDIEHTLGAAENSLRREARLGWCVGLMVHALVVRLSGQQPFGGTVQPQVDNRARRMMRIKPGIKGKTSQRNWRAECAAKQKTC